MRRFLFYLLPAVCLLTAVRMTAMRHSFTYDSGPQTVSGFLYRAPWHSSDTLVFLCPLGRALFSTRDFSPEFTEKLEDGCCVTLSQAIFTEPGKARNPNVFDYRLYLRSRGVTALCRCPESGVCVQKKVLPRYWYKVPGARFRNGARDILNAELGEKAGPLVAAIMNGSTGTLDAGIKSQFQKSGLAHLMAVSGTHVTFFLRPFRRIGKREKYGIARRNGMLFPPLLLFLLLTDFSPSVLRACISAAALALSRIVQRAPDTLNALALSLGIQVVLNPYCIFGSGFLLSYAASLSELLIRPALQRKISFFRSKKESRFLHFRLMNRDALCSGLAVQLGLFPLMLCLFGSCGLWGAVLTGYALPLSSFLLLGGFLLCGFGFLRLPAFVSALPASVLRFTVFLLEKLAAFGSRIPFGAVERKATGFFFIPVWYGVLVCLLSVRISLFIRKSRRRKAAALLVILAVFPAIGFFRWYRQDEIRVLFLDVGQGACTLLQLDGICGLIDTGDGSVSVSEAVKAQGVKRLDFVVLTHGHRDHAGGLSEILEHLRPRVLYLSQNDETGLAEAAKAAAATGVPVYVIRDRDVLCTGKTQIRFLICERFFGVSGDAAENNASVCVQVSGPYGSLLICGDLQSEAEEELCGRNVLSDVDILYVPHHGSASGCSEKFLSNIKPEYAIISVSAGNHYGHPSGETLQRLEKAGAAIYRTDRDGGVTVRIGRKNLFGKRGIEVWRTL